MNLSTTQEILIFKYLNQSKIYNYQDKSCLQLNIQNKNHQNTQFINSSKLEHSIKIGLKGGGNVCEAKSSGSIGELKKVDDFGSHFLKTQSYSAQFITEFTEKCQKIQYLSQQVQQQNKRSELRQYINWLQINQFKMFFHIMRSADQQQFDVFPQNLLFLLQGINNLILNNDQFLCIKLAEYASQMIQSIFNYQLIFQNYSVVNDDLKAKLKAEISQKRQQDVKICNLLDHALINIQNGIYQLPQDNGSKPITMDQRDQKLCEMVNFQDNLQWTEIVNQLEKQNLFKSQISQEQKKNFIFFLALQQKKFLLLDFLDQSYIKDPQEIQKFVVKHISQVDAYVQSQNNYFYKYCFIIFLHDIYLCANKETFNQESKLYLTTGSKYKNFIGLFAYAYEGLNPKSTDNEKSWKVRDRVVYTLFDLHVLSQQVEQIDIPGVIIHIRVREININVLKTYDFPDLCEQITVILLQNWTRKEKDIITEIQGDQKNLDQKRKILEIEKNQTLRDKLQKEIHEVEEQQSSIFLNLAKIMELTKIQIQYYYDYMQNNIQKSQQQIKKYGAGKDDKDEIFYQNFVMENSKNPKDYYKFGKMISENAYGEVYQIENKKTGQIRALKKISKDGLSVAEQKQSIVTDFLILKCLDHPNIVKIYEFYQDKQHFYVVTEYCDGGELLARVEEKVSLSEKEAASVIKQVLEVVYYTHRQGITHRDLRPENILLDASKTEVNNGEYAIKIIDWGNASFFENGKYMTQLIANPYYIAPEMALKKYTEKADLWSIGGILYTLLGGTPPFEGESPEEIQQQIINSQNWNIPQNQIWKAISNEAKDLIRKLMNYNPQNRLSAKEALAHSWFVNAPSKQIDPQIRKQCVQKMKEFRGSSKLQNAVLAFISSQLIDKADIKEQIAAFKAIDKDGNGTLTVMEIQNYYKDLLTEDQLQTMMSNIDPDNNGYVNYTQFVSMTVDRKQVMTQEKLKAAFDFFDVDNNGFITSDEIKKILGKDMKQKDEATWNDLMKKADLNNDGKLSFEEFKNMMETMI